MADHTQSLEKIQNRIEEIQAELKKLQQDLVSPEKKNPLLGMQDSSIICFTSPHSGSEFVAIRKLGRWSTDTSFSAISFDSIELRRILLNKGITAVTRLWPGKPESFLL